MARVAFRVTKTSTHLKTASHKLFFNRWSSAACALDLSVHNQVLPGPPPKVANSTCHGRGTGRVTNLVTDSELSAMLLGRPQEKRPTFFDAA